MSILEALAPHRDSLIALRREIHQEPELGFQELRTAARIRAFLDGVPVRSGVGRTGVVATLPSEARGPSLLLRVDMDGLPIQETTGAPYASRVPGVMHACGHDGHVAMGAVATRVLANRPF